MNRLLPFSFALAALLLASCGCRTAERLPPVDFSAPGWQVRQGQAVWKPSRSRPEIAGELLYALHTNGDCFVQFTKNPLPLVTATVRGDRWQIEFGAHKYFRLGRGAPPERFAWFQLPRLLRDAKATGDWRFTDAEVPDVWRLENRRTGETLEGSTFP